MKARLPSRWTVFCIAVGGVAVAVAAALALTGPRPSLVPVLLFGGLLAFANHQEVILPSGVGETPTLMLAMAAVAVFESQSPLLGPMLVGMFAGIYLPHLRAFEWRKMLGNLGVDGLAVLTAAVVFGGLSNVVGESPSGLLIIAVPVTLAYVVVSDVLVTMGVMLHAGASRAELLRELAKGTLHAYPFAILGIFMGRLYVDFGIVVLPLFIVPILIARQTFAAFLALRQSHDDTIRILIGALEAKDRYTAGHAERVARFAHFIGLELGLSPSRLERLRFAALMHDVGKLVVPNHLLNKPGKLTAEEFERVRQHETVSVEILTRIQFLAPVAPSALSEFTTFAPVADDRGQPIEPHIVAVADAFDAMTSTRSYRRALTQITAFMELREKSGTQFHPRCVDALIVAIERRGEMHGAGHETEIAPFSVPPPKMGTGSAGLGDLAPDPHHPSDRAPAT